MKKLGILALATLLVVAFTLPASAVESQFGGYWRTRFFTNQNFTGEDSTEALDFTWVDTRTRLYYTAIFHENLRFVNKFEFDTQWGTGPLGDIGADGMVFEIKNSYADFNTGPVNWKVGIQGGELARGFLFSDDFSGMTITYKGEGFSIPLIWIKAFEGGQGKDANELDVDYIAMAPTFKIADMMNLQAIMMWAYSEDAGGYNPLIHSIGARINDINGEELNVWYLGLNGDVDFGMGSAWFTALYQGGSIDDRAGGEDHDISAWLAAVGGNGGFGMFDIHGQAFYATGQDPNENQDIECFFVPSQNYGTGQSYYWSEIMGYGIFDWQWSNNSPGDKISNVWAVNLGTTIKPMDDLKISFDLWYAALAEDIIILDGSEETELGIEADLVITYQLVENLNLDLVGAYLFAGDATTMGSNDDANPYEVGARLSLSF